MHAWCTVQNWSEQHAAIHRTTSWPAAADLGATEQPRHANELGPCQVTRKGCRRCLSQVPIRCRKRADAVVCSSCGAVRIRSPIIGFWMYLAQLQPLAACACCGTRCSRHQPACIAARVKLTGADCPARHNSWMWGGESGVNERRHVQCSPTTAYCIACSVSQLMQRPRPCFGASSVGCQLINRPLTLPEQRCSTWSIRVHSPHGTTRDLGRTRGRPPLDGHAAAFRTNATNAATASHASSPRRAT